MSGPKIYEVTPDIQSQVEAIAESPTAEHIETLTEAVKAHIRENIAAPAAEGYGMKKGTQNRLERQAERHKAEQEKQSVEEEVRAHLRGFSRTIPSFIMAYGDGSLTLTNFDDYTEDDVFEKVQVIRQQRHRMTRTGRSSIFSGLVFCADCGSKMQHGSSLRPGLF